MDQLVPLPARGRFPPIPFPSPITIAGPLQPGPHHYSVRTWVGSVSHGNTPQQAFESLLWHATPGQQVQSNGQDPIDIPVLGRVAEFPGYQSTTPVGPSAPAASPAPEWPRLSGPPISKVPSYEEYMKLLGLGSSVPDATTPGSPFPPAPSPSGTDGGWFARMMADADSDDPTQFRPTPADDDLSPFYRDDAAQPWTLRRLR